MFRSSPDIEHTESDTSRARAQVDPSELIPLSVLALDLPAPSEGWADFLGRRAIAFVPDDLGRDCIRRQDARRLLDEKRANELRVVKLRQLAEQEAVEADQQFRATIGVGVPTSMIPADSTYAQAALSAQLNDLEYKPRRVTLMEEIFSNSKEMTVYPLEREEVNWE
jgi:hypothetical protein